jgi:hypothetical protein
MTPSAWRRLKALAWAGTLLLAGAHVGAGEGGVGRGRHRGLYSRFFFQLC